MKFQLIVFMVFSFSTFAESVYPIRTQECENFNEEFAKQVSPTKLVWSQDKEQLSTLTFKYKVVGYGENGRVETEVDEVPVVALPVANGWLLGSNRGEWGGSLVFKRFDGEQQEIINDNIEDIYEYPYGYIVTAGLAHLSFNSGQIYLVSYENNRYKSEVLYGLVASPDSSWIMSSGDLLINHSGSASTIFSSTGSLYRVKCSNFKSDDE